MKIVMSTTALAGEHRRPLRPLVPRNVSSKVLKSGTQLRPRATAVLVACSTCRKRKVKCSGERPACRRCAKEGSPCVYVALPGETTSQALSRDFHALQNRATVYEELFDTLKNLPDQDANDVLQRIRSGIDATTILSHLKTGSALLQMAVMPETRYRYDFPYRSEFPESLTTDNLYLDTLIYESTTSSLRSRSRGAAKHRVFPLGNKPHLVQHLSPYLKPFHAAQVVEERLSDAKLSSWTSVCSDNMLMRDLLQTFFRCEYQFSAAFQKDLFFEDMKTHRQDFCSSLLVNIMLAYACVCSPQFSNRAQYWNPHTLEYRFLAEARRLWELEASEPRITTVQAGILFTVFYNLCGLDEVGKAYRVHAVALAHKLNLFSNTLNEENNSVRRGRAFTAWTLYNWETLTAFSFMQPPLLKKPPDWPLPDLSDDLRWYGEIWLQYPLEPGLTSSHFGHVFRAKCLFRTIMNEFCQMAYSNSTGIDINQAYDLRDRLRYWYDSLPEPLWHRAIVLPGHLQLHVYYHHLILSIYEPICDVKTDCEPAPDHIVADAKKHIETLIRLYYLRHGFEAMDLFIVIPLMLLGYDCIDLIDANKTGNELKVLQSTLLLIAQGLSTQRRNHYLAEALFRVLRGRMRPREVALLGGLMNLDKNEPSTAPDMVQAVRSHWPVSVVKKKEEVHDHILTNLVQTYAHLNVEGTTPTTADPG